jgi:hypothetical protein
MSCWIIFEPVCRNRIHHRLFPLREVITLRYPRLTNGNCLFTKLAAIFSSHSPSSNNFFIWKDTRNIKHIGTHSAFLRSLSTLACHNYLFYKRLFYKTLTLQRLFMTSTTIKQRRSWIVKGFFITTAIKWMQPVNLSYLLSRSTKPPQKA